MQFIECNPSHQCAELLPHAPSRSEPTREHALINPAAPLHHGAICRQACPWQHLEVVPPLEQAGWHLFLTHRPALLAGERDGEWGMRENWADGEAERRAGRQHAGRSNLYLTTSDKWKQQKSQLQALTWSSVWHRMAVAGARRSRALMAEQVRPLAAASRYLPAARRGGLQKTATRPLN